MSTPVARSTGGSGSGELPDEGRMDVAEGQNLDIDLVRRYALTTWGFKQGEMVSLMIHLGHRLGLYEAMDGAGPLTAGELASSTG